MSVGNTYSIPVRPLPSKAANLKQARYHRYQGKILFTQTTWPKFPQSVLRRQNDNTNTALNRNHPPVAKLRQLRYKYPVSLKLIKYLFLSIYGKKLGTIVTN